MTAPHLDDDYLSDHLDGAAAHPHLSSCTVCSERLSALGAARDAVAAAGVAPLPQSAIDEMVARAMGAADTTTLPSEVSLRTTATTVASAADLAARRGRRTPPPPWLITAAAAIAALAGIAGLLRATGSDDGSARLATGSGNRDAAGVESSGGPEDDRLSGSATGTPQVATAAVDPEVVQTDLGDQDDPANLTALLSGGQADQAAGPPHSGRPAAASDEEGSQPPSPTTTAAGADRARCRTEAERIGAGRFARLVSTSTVRWKATPAEVLVFSLTEPSGGVSRQAMVLARSNCALLADPRF